MSPLAKWWLAAVFKRCCGWSFVFTGFFSLSSPVPNRPVSTGVTTKRRELNKVCIIFFFSFFRPATSRLLPPDLLLLLLLGGPLTRSIVEGGLRGRDPRLSLPRATINLQPDSFLVGRSVYSCRQRPNSNWIRLAPFRPTRPISCRPSLHLFCIYAPYTICVERTLCGRFLHAGTIVLLYQYSSRDTRERERERERKDGWTAADAMHKKKSRSEDDLSRVEFVSTVAAPAFHGWRSPSALEIYPNCILLYILLWFFSLSLGSAGVPTRIRIRFSIFPHKETKKKMECNMRVQTAPKMWCTRCRRKTFGTHVSSTAGEHLKYIYSKSCWYF